MLTDSHESAQFLSGLGQFLTDPLPGIPEGGQLCLDFLRFGLFVVQQLPKLLSLMNGISAFLLLI